MKRRETTQTVTQADRFASVKRLLDEKNITQAYPLLVTLAEGGYAMAQYQLALLYSQGKDVAQDDRSAVKWFYAAARQGEMLAQYNLALMIEQERGAVRNEQEVMKWYLAAAKQGYVLAQYNLGCLYAQKDEEDPNTSQYAVEAARWFLAAAEQKDPLAQVNLGMLYAQGRGVLQDDERALYWYRLSADQQCAVGQYHLGLCYAKGGGVQRDDRVALAWFHAAAKQEYALASYQLGVIHAQGRGLDQNLVEALYWIRIAAKQGYALAQYNLGILYRDGCGVKQNLSRAQYWFQRAAKSREPVGLVAQSALEELQASNRVLPPVLPMPPLNRAERPLIKASEQPSRLDVSHRILPMLPRATPGGPNQHGLPDSTPELTFIRSLGQGRWGVVYEATWSGIPVAVKQLTSLSPAATRMFCEQAQQLLSLQCPSLLPVYALIHGNPLSVVMEYMAGGSLSTVLAQRTFSWITRVQMALNMARSLSFLHERGYLHGALKSANVLMDKQGNVKLADGGWSQVAPLAVQRVEGQVPWMAPELFQAGACMTTSSDVYAFGVLLWEIGSGRLPYAGITDDRAIRDYVCVGQREVLPAKWPDFFKALIEQCWAHSPTQRPVLSALILVLEQGLHDLKTQPVVMTQPSSTSVKHTVSAPNVANQGTPRRVASNNNNNNLSPQTPVRPLPSVMGRAGTLTPSHLFAGFGRGSGSPPQRGIAPSPQQQARSLPPQPRTEATPSPLPFRKN